MFRWHNPLFLHQKQEMRSSREARNGKNDGVCPLCMIRNLRAGLAMSCRHDPCQNLGMLGLTKAKIAKVRGKWTCSRAGFGQLMQWELQSWLASPVIESCRVGVPCLSP